MRHHIVFRVLLLVFCAVLTNRTQAASPGKQVITGEEIRQAGLTRLGDVLLLVDDWSVNSTDGYVWQVSPNGLSSLGRQSWSVYINGQQYRLRTIDRQQLNFLPVTLTEIDSVEVYSLPRLVHGEFVTSGMIRIHTGTPKEGLEGNAHLMMGNETGDPGPYRYTRFAAPNKDRFGDRETVSLRYGTNRWYAGAALQNDIVPFADFYQHKRVRPLINEPPGVLEPIPSVRIGTRMPSEVHQLQFSQTVPVKAFLYFPSMGRELPYKPRFTHAGISGQFAGSGRMPLRYQFTYSNNALLSYENSLGFLFDWEMWTLEGMFEKEYVLNMVSGSFGAGYAYNQLLTRFVVENNTTDLSRVFGNARYRVGERIQQEVGVSVETDGQQVFPNVAMSTVWDAGESYTVNAHLSYSASPIFEEYPLWFWEQRGYALLSRYEVPYERSADSFTDPVEVVTGELLWEYDMGYGLRLEGDLKYRRFQGLVFEQRGYRFQPESCTFPGVMRVLDGQSGRLLGGSVALFHRLSERIWYRVFYEGWKTKTGSQLFREARDRIPDHRAGFRITYVPVRNFSIWGMVKYQSATHWADFELVDGSICAGPAGAEKTFRSELPGFVSLDLQFKKWFWRRRMTVSLLLRNLTDKPYQYHPVGNGYNLSFYLTMTLFLGRVSNT